ncbi:hypothetical protein GCM10023185_13330 [Hymenobacter saemangeumensis]|uniref:DNA-binding protein n=1 Tax=Hymenobacter saemangeumensis TaxID=1084522 RepID=A0ABP8I7Q2_9BACT
MSPAPAAFKIQPYNKTQLASYYGVGIDTLNAWLKDVPELGEYRGRLFTKKQVQAIVEHLGEPDKH